MRFPYASIGHYEINQFPCCAQLAVFNHAFIKKEFRGKGWGKLQHSHRLMNAKGLGYDYALCTVVSTNAAEKRILAINGWKRLDEFKNSETENTVEIWGRKIGEQTHTEITPQPYSYEFPA